MQYVSIEQQRPSEHTCEHYWNCNGLVTWKSLEQHLFSKLVFQSY